jgi:hypothetical protein
VPRPAVLTRFFRYSPRIDNHNQMRQGELALEERWVTQDCWFRLYTSLLGMHVTDLHLAVRHAACPGSGLNDLTINEFADILSHDLIFNSETPLATRAGESAATVQQRALAAKCCDDHLSGLAAFPVEMRPGKTAPFEPYRYQQMITCSISGCSYKSMWYCLDCFADGKTKALCSTKRRNCLARHQREKLLEQREVRRQDSEGGGAGGGGGT